jgi:transcription initiation factor TFIIB
MASSPRYYINEICCDAHPDSLLIEDNRLDDQVCSECGLVVGERIIGSEWPTFSNEEAGADPFRVHGSEITLFCGSDLSTLIGPGHGDVSFDGFGVSEYQSRRNISRSDSSLNNAFQEITSMADRMHLPKIVVDRANKLFKQMHDGKNLKGRANNAIASACLYIACRQEGVPHTLKEICAVSRSSKRVIGRCFKLMLKTLEIGVDLITAEDFMSRFCSNLGLPNMVQHTATHIARKAVELDIVPGRSPISVAAAAIYMASQASKDKRNQKEIGEIAGVADVTVRQSYKLMYPHASKLFPESRSSPTRRWDTILSGCCGQLEHSQHRCSYGRTRVNDWRQHRLPRELHSDQDRSTRTKGKSPKLQSSWEGPYKIINNAVHRIQRNPTSNIMIVHLDLLAPSYQGAARDERP